MELIIILVLVIGVIALQVVFFRQTKSDIKELLNFFPKEDAFDYLSIEFKNDLEETEFTKIKPESVSELFGIDEDDEKSDLFDENEDEDEEEGEVESKEDDDIEEVEDDGEWFPISIKNSLFVLSNSPHMREVLTETNRYLKANDGATADFNLLSDICESKILTVEKKAEANLPLPLFVGLMGTFIGVIVGVTFILLSKSDFNFDVIQRFLGGILIAMIGSFFGLLFTTLNTHFYFKNAKDQTEIRKFNYLNFIRASLLPHLNETMSDSFSQLRDTLTHFNRDFKENVSTFHLTISQVREYANDQKEFLSEINKVGLKQVTESNLRILQEFTRASDEFSRVSGYLTKISTSYNNLSQVLEYSKEIFSRFNRFDEILNSLGDNYSDNIKLLEKSVRVLDQNYSSLNNVNDLVKQHVQSSNYAIEQFIEHEKNKVDLLVQSLNEKLINAFDDHAKNKILDEIAKIDEIKLNLGELVKASNNSNSSIIRLLEFISKKPQNGRGNKGPLSLQMLINEMDQIPNNDVDRVLGEK